MAVKNVTPLLGNKNLTSPLEGKKRPPNFKTLPSAY